ncbi:MAG: ABC transporter ATP-binding protein, partial [Ruminococcaceae bacterium]|nr:ABC transporter ATP-binding protein [Oscillospiraceae bacterium]
TVVIIWLGAKAIEASTLQIGDMLAFMQYAMHIIMSFLFIAMMFIIVPRAMVSARRIAEVLDNDYSVKEPQNPKTLKNADGKGRQIDFSDVSFRYENASEDVLTDISFTAKPGETTAIIGSTGSGKSTILNLIMRFYDVTGGSIKIDGTDIRDITTDELRGTIGFVPQKGVLFSGTIEENLRYGKEDASGAEILEAIETAQAKEFVDELEEKTEHQIAQGGGNVSGGQKQRLAIARALVKKAPVYIFDDSFSALDFKTDASLRRALEKTMKQSTVIIVAQRVGTIMNAEQIIVLDNGKIVGKGTHRELLKNCETYREIAESQLSKEELA